MVDDELQHARRRHGQLDLAAITDAVPGGPVTQGAFVENRIRSEFLSRFWLKYHYPYPGTPPCMAGTPEACSPARASCPLCGRCRTRLTPGSSTTSRVHSCTWDCCARP